MSSQIKDSSFSLFSSKKCSISLAFILHISQAFHFISSIQSLKTTFSCQINSTEARYSPLCLSIFHKTTCRQLSTPVSLHLTLDLQKKSNAFVDIVCPFNVALSEFRITLTLCNFFFSSYITYCYFKGFYVSLEKKIFLVVISVFYVVCLFIELTEIRTARKENFDVCAGEIGTYLGSGVDVEKAFCDYSAFENIAFGNLFIGVISLLMGLIYIKTESKTL